MLHVNAMAITCRFCPCTSLACSGAATDVVFLIDGSKSVRPENFELVKKWINQIVDKLDVSEAKTHVGLVQYSSSVKQVCLCVCVRACVRVCVCVCIRYVT